MGRIYFGHPVNTYNTPLEERALAAIRITFPRHEIENPNQPHHQVAYQEWKARTGNGMQYYFEEILPKCTSGIFLPFPDGKWGAGVWGEAKWLHEHGCEHTLYMIRNDLVIKPFLLEVERGMALSVEETRKRVYSKP